MGISEDEWLKVRPSHKNIFSLQNSRMYPETGAAFLYTATDCSNGQREWLWKRSSTTAALEEVREVVQRVKVTIGYRRQGEIVCERRAQISICVHSYFAGRSRSVNVIKM